MNLPDESFTASSSATDHNPYDGRLIDMSIYARQLQTSGEGGEKTLFTFKLIHNTYFQMLGFQDIIQLANISKSIYWRKSLYME